METRQATQTDQSSQQRFAHLTNLSVELTNVAALSATGRLRWKIESAPQAHRRQVHEELTECA